MFESILNLLHSIVQKKLKIAIISYYYPFKKTSTSGVGTHSYNLVTNLSRAGCEVHVFTSGIKNSKEKIRVGKGKIVIHFLNPGSKFGINDPVVEKRVKYAIFENMVLNEVIYENEIRKFDVIHTHGWLTSSAFMLRSLIKVPWVHTVHALERKRLPSMTEEEKKMFRITSWIEDTLSDADCLIAVSENVKGELVKSFKSVTRKIRVIPNGVDLNLFKDEPKKGKIVLSISRFSKEKGIDIIPDIAEYILKKNKKCEFILVAQETKLPTLQEIQNDFRNLQNRYKERFKWISEPLSPPDIAQLYRKSVIYVQPSIYETFGLCILEAMASGNAVVASEIGGIPEVVGKAGILVKPSPKIMSGKILYLLKNKKEREEYRKKAVERAKIFDWKDVAQKTINLYEEVGKKYSSKKRL